MAYNEIKGRTGQMVDGVFVKSSDWRIANDKKAHSIQHGFI